jgi:hypothetical protein
MKRTSLAADFFHSADLWKMVRREHGKTSVHDSPYKTKHHVIIMFEGILSVINSE